MMKSIHGPAVYPDDGRERSHKAENRIIKNVTSGLPQELQRFVRSNPNKAHLLDKMTEQAGVIYACGLGLNFLQKEVQRQGKSGLWTRWNLEWDAPSEEKIKPISGKSGRYATLIMQLREKHKYVLATPQVKYDKWDWESWREYQAKKAKLDSSFAASKSVNEELYKADDAFNKLQNLLNELFTEDAPASKANKKGAKGKAKKHQRRVRDFSRNRRPVTRLVYSKVDANQVDHANFSGSRNVEKEVVMNKQERSLLEAIRRLKEGDREPIGGFSVEWLENFGFDEDAGFSPQDRVRLVQGRSLRKEVEKFEKLVMAQGRRLKRKRHHPHLQRPDVAMDDEETMPGHLYRRSRQVNLARNKPNDIVGSTRKQAHIVLSHLRHSDGSSLSQLQDYEESPKKKQQ